MREPLIELRDVTLGYRGSPVIEHVSFVIERGEFVGLFGPNGAGKTTLLRGILQLIPVLAGQIVYHFDRTASPPGYVPQRDTLDPIFPLSAFEVVLMGTYAKLPPLWPLGRQRRRVAARCLDQVGLAAVSGEPFWALSGGQKQRVLIARALAAQPSLMVLDEPTAGVDHAAEDAIIELIARLHQTEELTVVLVSHHLARIRSVVQSAVWVEEGRATKGPVEALPAADVPAAVGASA